MRAPSKSIKLSLTLAFVVCALAARGHHAGAAADTPARPRARRASAFNPQLPRGIPLKVWRQSLPPDNPLTEEKVALGRALYFDKRLSADGTVSCATCHDPATAFADNRPVAVGVNNRVGPRNAPTLLNAAFSPLLFWDGRARTLEEQVLEPLFNPAEMGMTDRRAVVARLEADADYPRLFAEVFGRASLTVENAAKALAAFERTQFSGDSPFDRFVAGDTGAITKAQHRGWLLFRGKARCITCHAFSAAAPFFTDFKFHNTGVAVGGANLERLARAAGTADLGRYAVTKKAEDLGAFRTPTLRDVELTAPYMHDGSEKTLLDVVRFYDRGGEKNPRLDRRLRPLRLSEQEMSDLVEFLRALTSEAVMRQAQAARPQTRLPFAPDAGEKSRR
jgi:cytochrome c peroxidase